MCERHLGTLPRLIGRSMAMVMVLVGGTTLPAVAQDRGNPYGEWRYWGADQWSTRYSPLDQINADNFEELEVAWIWRGDNFGPAPDFIMRSTPIYADGLVYTVAGTRRTLAALDPATGETLGPSANRTRSAGRAHPARTMAEASLTPRSTDGA